MDHRLAEELSTIRRRLEQLGEALSSDRLLLQGHGFQLQSMDLIMQQLGHLADVLQAEDKAVAAERVSMQDLRKGLNRKAIRSILS